MSVAKKHNQLSYKIKVAVCRLKPTALNLTLNAIYAEHHNHILIERLGIAVRKQELARLSIKAAATTKLSFILH